MKKLLVLLAVLIFSASTALAGEVGEIRYGIKAGFNMTTAWGDSVPDEATWAYGAGAGVFMNYRAHEMFVIQPEAMFMWKGWKEDWDDGSFTLKLYYVDINVLAKLTIPMDGMVKPCLFAGPYLGLKISHGWSSDPEITGDMADEIDKTFDDYLKAYDVGLVVGGGIDIELESGGMIVFDVRYSMGFIKLFDVYEDAEEAYDAKNQGISIMAGYAF